MSLHEHHRGHGKEVMKSMKKTYGDAMTAKKVFYATENKRKKKKEMDYLSARMK